LTVEEEEPIHYDGYEEGFTGGIEIK